MIAQTLKNKLYKHLEDKYSGNINSLIPEVAIENLPPEIGLFEAKAEDELQKERELVKHWIHEWKVKIIREEIHGYREGLPNDVSSEAFKLFKEIETFFQESSLLSPTSKKRSKKRSVEIREQSQQFIKKLESLLSVFSCPQKFNVSSINVNNKIRQYLARLEGLGENELTPVDVHRISEEFEVFPTEENKNQNIGPPKIDRISLPSQLFSKNRKKSLELKRVDCPTEVEIKPPDNQPSIRPVSTSPPALSLPLNACNKSNKSNNLSKLSKLNNFNKPLIPPELSSSSSLMKIQDAREETDRLQIERAINQSKHSIEPDKDYKDMTIIIEYLLSVIDNLERDQAHLRKELQKSPKPSPNTNPNTSRPKTGPKSGPKLSPNSTSKLSSKSPSKSPSNSTSNNACPHCPVYLSHLSSLLSFSEALQKDHQELFRENQANKSQLLAKIEEIEGLRQSLQREDRLQREVYQLKKQRRGLLADVDVCRLSLFRSLKLSWSSQI